MRACSIGACWSCSPLKTVSCPSGPLVQAQDLTEDEEADAVDEDVVDDVTAEDEDNEAEVEDDENVELVSSAVMKRKENETFFLMVFGLRDL